VYLCVLVLVSLTSPGRVVKLGENQCFDDWCIAVTDVRRETTDSGPTLAVTFRISSRAKRRAQRENGLSVYLVDGHGRRYDPAPAPDAPPFGTLLQPGEAVTTSRVFPIPADIGQLGLVVSHGGGFPVCVIIGDSESLFHKPTVVQLD
jgi:hypothetical protein